MKVHYLNVGHGNMALIEFDNCNVLIDCNISDVEDNAFKYLQEKIGQNGTIDYLIITHPHLDHIKGLKYIDANFNLVNIWESGFRINTNELGNTEHDQQLKDNYNYFIDLINQKTSTILSASSDPLDFSEANINAYCLNSQSDDNTDIHYNSLVVKFEKDGKSLLFTGDSNCEVWEESVVEDFKEELIEANLLLASHHGSRTFFYCKNEKPEENSPYIDGLNIIDPEYTIISGLDNKDKKDDWPPHEDAVKLYKKYTSSKGGIFITGRDDTIVFELTGGSFLLNEAQTTQNARNSFKRGQKQPRIPQVSIIGPSQREEPKGRQTNSTWG